MCKLKVDDLVVTNKSKIDLYTFVDNTELYQNAGIVLTPGYIPYYTCKSTLHNVICKNPMLVIGECINVREIDIDMNDPNKILPDKNVLYVHCLVSEDELRGPFYINENDLTKV